MIAFAALALLLWLLPFFMGHGSLFPPGPTYEDILVYRGRFSVYHTTAFFRSRAFSAFAYPAGAAPIYEMVYKTADPVRTYLVAACAAGSVAVLAAWIFLRRVSCATLLLPLVLATAFPFVWLVQRANVELVLWVVVALGFGAYWAKLRWLAALLFGVAAAIKLYPVLLLGLFLRGRRDGTALTAGCAAALATTWAAVSYTGPTFDIAARGFFTGVDRFQDHYVDAVSKVEIAFDHCLFSPVKYWAWMQHVSPAGWRTTYYIVAGAIFIGLLLRVRTLPFLNRAVFLTTAMVCLPPVSFNYTLVHLYFPLLLVVATLALLRRRPPVTLVLALVLLLSVLLPLAGLSAFGTLPTGPLQSALLFLLLLTAAMTAWPTTRADAA